MPDREQFLSQGGSLFVTLKRYRSSLILGGVGLACCAYGIVDTTMQQSQVKEDAIRLFPSPFSPVVLDQARDRASIAASRVRSLALDYDWASIRLVVNDPSLDEAQGALRENSRAEKERWNYWGKVQNNEQSEFLGLGINRFTLDSDLAFGGIGLMLIGFWTSARSRLKRSPNLGSKRELSTSKR